MHADFSVTPICACTRVLPWASINREGEIKTDGKVGKKMAEKERDYGTREQRGCGEERMRKKKRRKVPRKTHSRLNIACPVASSSLLHLCKNRRVTTAIWAKARSREWRKKPICTVWERMCLCVCWSVVVFSDLCRLWLSSSSWVFGVAFLLHGENPRSFQPFPAYRRHSLTWWLNILLLPPELTPPNGKMLYPCK